MLKGCFPYQAILLVTISTRLFDFKIFFAHVEFYEVWINRFFSYFQGWMRVFPVLCQVKLLFLVKEAV